MGFNALVLQVLIASPSDVQEERNTIPEVIYKWNALNAEHEEVVLLPVKWETHSLSEYRGEDTQEILNEQFVRKSDILVGALWTKIGTRTVKSDSGTVEEIEEFIKTQKPVKLYISARGLPNDVDLEELQRLREFKTKYQTQGIYKEYKSLENLNELLLDDLTREVRRYKSKILSIKSNGNQENENIIENPRESINEIEKKN
ncbi:hypothetical protein [Metabacillus fastidiosus]|uniref:hypothetical protein n=1 Tax=Metabacillus fastidiosus TaxID=1458 RepID=UPI002DBBE981|nr:hypothetical protein [Metabacillus fastidiosus]MEC2076391.1 hypothetical protein [Metabacillus fastidiosus]